MIVYILAIIGVIIVFLFFVCVYALPGLIIGSILGIIWIFVPDDTKKKIRQIPVKIYKSMRTLIPIKNDFAFFFVLFVIFIILMYIISGIVFSILY